MCRAYGRPVSANGRGLPCVVFRAHHRNDPPGIVLVGEVDLAALPELRREIRNLATGEAATVDLTAVTFIDSVGVGLLLGGARRAREAGGHLTLVVNDGRVRDTLIAFGVDRLIPLVLSG